MLSVFWVLTEKGFAGKRIGVCFDIVLYAGREMPGHDERR